MITVIDLIKQQVEAKVITKGQLLGKLYDAQEMVLAANKAKLNYVSSWIKEKIIKVNDHAFLQNLLKDNKDRWCGEID